MSKLIQQKMIEVIQHKNFITTITTINNYEAYQGDEQQKMPKVIQQTDSRRTADGHEQEVKEVKEVKEELPPPSARENWVSKGGAIWERHLGSVNYGEFGKVLKPMFEELGEQKFLSTVESYCVKRNGKSSIRHLASTYKTVMPRVHTGVQL
jgi:hypothetical protein